MPLKHNTTSLGHGSLLDVSSLSHTYVPPAGRSISYLIYEIRAGLLVMFPSPRTSNPLSPILSLVCPIPTLRLTASLNDAFAAGKGISALGSVMAFLYSTYIVLNAVLSTVLGKVMDNDFAKNNNILWSLKTVGGVQFSVCCVIILLATFVPKGAFALNPKAIGDVSLQGSNESVDEESSVERVEKPTRA